ncbi:MAG: hypothetical protein ACYTCU_01650 [Planctomycetota bacterium]|jgi:hypothetical protein
MAKRATALLSELEGLKDRFGGVVSATKLALLSGLRRARFSRADDVLRLHELLCFMRAYADDAAVLERVERMLDAFDRRSDLRACAEELANSGVAGTPTDYRFYAPTARWLAKNWGERLHLDWGEFENAPQLDELMHHFALWSETPGLDESGDGAREWFARMAGPDETDAAFLVRSFDGLDLAESLRVHMYEQLDPPMRLDPGPDTPSRTRARFAGSPRIFQTGPLDSARPKLPGAIRRKPVSERAVSPREAKQLVDMTREAMVTRARDLDVFMFGDARDVRLIDWGDGLQFAAFCAKPDRRLLLESVYGMLTLKNGVPMGYVLISALFGSSEIAYNVFETFRGGEAGAVYGAVLATAHHLFGSDTFTIYPYQLGDNNMEALSSGAWWFYQKLGFRSRDPGVLRLMKRELATMSARKGHRSSIPTLRKLAEHNVYYDMGKPRDDVIGELPMGKVGEAVTDMLAARFGSDRRRAARELTVEARDLLGLRSLRGWDAGERLTLQRWAPLIAVLPGVSRWSAADKKALVAVVRAKGGRRESDFVRRFDAHKRLRRAVVKLARQG